MSYDVGPRTAPDPEVSASGTEYSGFRRPKLHFVDSGLACHLLGSSDYIPLQGALFESWVAAEVAKARLHSGRPVDLYHMREDRGVEIDLVAESGQTVYGVDVKSGATLAQDFLPPLHTFTDRVAEDLPHLHPVPRLLYGGDRRETRSGIEVIPWQDVQSADW